MDQVIATQILKGYKDPQWYAKDHFIETPDKKYALYFYNVVEGSMMAYYANLSIFVTNNFDAPLLSSGKTWIWYERNKPFIYAQKSGCIIFKMPASDKATKGRNFPYLLIKPATGQFSFIDWDVTSIYYSMEEVSENILLVTEQSPKELDRFNTARRAGETIKLNELMWYDLTQFDDAQEIYGNS